MLFLQQCLFTSELFLLPYFRSRTSAMRFRSRYTLTMHNSSRNSKIDPRPQKDDEDASSRGRM